MQYKLIVFDWDGTLADSLEQIVTVMEKAISDMQLEQRSPASIRSIIGLGLTESVRTLYPDISDNRVVELVDSYRTNYLIASKEPVRLFPGVEKVLAQLHSDGYLLAVATGKSRRGLNRSLNESGVEDMFHTTRCADETFSKPHPQMLHEIMDVFGMLAEDTLMIGDSEHDLRMANNAGVDSVAVNYGAQEAEHLLGFDPLLCIESLEELPCWLKKRRNAFVE